MKILIIEDEESYKNSLITKLSNEGFEVISAKNGSEGFLLAINEKPDLILLDLNIPVENGLSVFHRIRENSTWGKSVPVFIISVISPSDEKINQEITKLEPTYYLHKADVSIAFLVDKIKDKLNL